MNLKLNREEHLEYNNRLDKYINHETVLQMKNYIQHGTISTYDHCHSVARLAMAVNRRLSLGADEEILLPAAFLHDLYLYDWHIPGDHNKLHGFTHAKIASNNAVKHFRVNKKVEDAIRSHMWPMNITRVPNSREAWILCIVDKIISTKETADGYIYRFKGLKKHLHIN